MTGSTAISVLQQEALVGTALGLTSHLGLFIRGEWHLQAPTLLKTWIGSIIVLYLVFHYVFDRASTEAFQHTSILLGSFTSAAFTSLVVYRLFFHRLCRFPGPRLAPVSKLWHAYQCRDSKQYQLLDGLREQYGDFVRTGPTELLITDERIFDVLDGPRNTCEKANWYDILQPALAIISVRDKKTHDRRRRVWDRGLNAKSLVEYRPRLLLHVDQLLERVAEAAKAQCTVRINDLFGWYAFDSMGDFAFGTSYGMLDTQKWHDATLKLRRGMSLLGPMSSVPWAAIIGLQSLPWFWRMADFLRMKDYCVEQMKDRVLRKDARGDIATEFIRTAQENGMTQEDRRWLAGDAMTVIIGGSETTSSTLTFVAYRLALDHTLQERLFDEIKGINRDDVLTLRNCPLLNAVINETLRLNPALPSAVYRQTPPEGVMLGDTYLPGDINILAPRYVIARRTYHSALPRQARTANEEAVERNFAKANEFIPERWTTRPELVKERKAFNPFGIGRYSCAGKQVALEEMLFVVSGLVQGFHVRLAPGETGLRVERDMKDQLSAVPGPLDLRFEPRQSAGAA